MPFRFRDGRAARPLTDARVTFSGSIAEVAGLHVEIGENPSWEVDDLATDGLYLAVNLSESCSFEQKEGGTFRHAPCLNNSVWLNPPGRVFSHRVATPIRYGGISLSLALLGTALGDIPQMRPGYGLTDPALVGLARLILDAAGRTDGHALYVGSLATAIAAHSTLTYGSSPRPLPATRLPAARVRRVDEYVRANLGTALDVTILASLAGQSPAHFIKMFRLATGETPHRYVMRVRLEAARDALACGERASQVATRLGFADQSHLTRLFRRAFGVTPAAFRRSHDAAGTRRRSS